MACGRSRFLIWVLQVGKFLSSLFWSDCSFPLFLSLFGWWSVQVVCVCLSFGAGLLITLHWSLPWIEECHGLLTGDVIFYLSECLLILFLFWLAGTAVLLWLDYFWWSCPGQEEKTCPKNSIFSIPNWHFSLLKVILWSLAGFRMVFSTSLCSVWSLSPRSMLSLWFKQWCMSPKILNMASI